eukprot:3204898-Rhodomonas_salina.1
MRTRGTGYPGYLWGPRQGWARGDRARSGASLRIPKSVYQTPSRNSGRHKLVGRWVGIPKT